MQKISLLLVVLGLAINVQATGSVAITPPSLPPGYITHVTVYNDEFSQFVYDQSLDQPDEGAPPTQITIPFDAFTGDAFNNGFSLDIYYIDPADINNDEFFYSVPSGLDTSLNYNLTFSHDETGYHGMFSPVPEPSTGSFFFGGYSVGQLWENPALAFNSATVWVIGAVGVLCVVGWITRVMARNKEYAGEVSKARYYAHRYGKK